MKNKRAFTLVMIAILTLSQGAVSSLADEWIMDEEVLDFDDAPGSDVQVSNFADTPIVEELDVMISDGDEIADNEWVGEVTEDVADSEPNVIENFDESVSGLIEDMTEIAEEAQELLADSPNIYIENAFPDDVFRRCVTEFDTNSDGYLSQDECDAVEEIDVNHEGITTLTGISFFPKLTYLNCVGNELKSLDLGDCKELINLDCHGNKLTTLDVRMYPKLEELDCGDNGMTTLLVSGCTSLKFLYCNDDELTELDVSNCPLLDDLSCTGNQLTELDLSSNTVLTALNCEDNQLVDINVSECAALEYLKCDGNQLTNLNVSRCPKLYDLFCDYNKLESLDISGCAKLINLYCQGNQLTKLDISASPCVIYAYHNGVHTTVNDIEEYEDQDKYHGCFLFDKGVKIIALHDHSYSDWTITTPVTCTTAGVKTRTCGCGDTKTEIIPATGIHTPVTDPAVAATTTSEGKTEGSHCAVCGTVLVAQQTIPKIVPDTTVTPQPEALVMGIEQITVPNKPTVKKPVAAKNNITAKWSHFKHTTKKTKPIWKKIKKVQVQCATDKAFTNIVKTAMVGKNKTKAVVKGLKPKTTYFVRVRYYDGTGYSKWSGVKKIKTKK